jgi:hypothetical protein
MNDAAMSGHLSLQMIEEARAYLVISKQVKKGVVSLAITSRNSPRFSTQSIFRNLDT